jgi:hypothetical protein
MPSPGTTPTLVTVPADDALAMLVILPYASTDTVGYVYVPAETPDVARSIVIFPPEPIKGLPVTAIRELEIGTKPTVEIPPPPLPPPTAAIVKLPGVTSAIVILESAGVRLNTPVLVKSTLVLELPYATVIPETPLIAVNGLVLENKLAKLSLVLLNAVYNESDPIDSF